ncbi:MAG TPA: DUF1284 domain-containing protein [bacterium]|nr:DUF1284 domain-containing protein [bacterium]HNS48712.1 DUF1284 domain-containing protein [bacterium]
MRLRGHHLLCLLGFRGLGYSPEFVARMQEVRSALNSKRRFFIQVVTESDDICRACPYHSNNACRKGSLSVRRTAEMDRRTLQYLGLQPGRRISADRLLKIIPQRLGDFDRLVKICGRCGWREVCNYYLELRSRWRRSAL